jgi:hypothetical protein
VRRWVPKAYAGQPIYTFETGGSTGVPKSRINIHDFRIVPNIVLDRLGRGYAIDRFTCGGCHRSHEKVPQTFRSQSDLIRFVERIAP